MSLLLQISWRPWNGKFQCYPFWFLSSWSSPGTRHWIRGDPLPPLGLAPLLFLSQANPWNIIIIIIAELPPSNNTPFSKACIQSYNASSISPTAIINIIIVSTKLMMFVMKRWSPGLTGLDGLFSHGQTASVLSSVLFHILLKRVFVPDNFNEIWTWQFPWKGDDDAADVHTWLKQWCSVMLLMRMMVIMMMTT